MGSISNIMSRLKRSDAAVATPPEHLEQAVETDAAMIAAELESTGLDDSVAGAFVADPPTAHIGDLDGRVVAWDPRKIDPAVVAFHSRYSAVCEQFRSVRARLANNESQRANQILVVTSSLPQEGKSVTTANLGIVIAEGGEHSVLIADADFRRTSIAHMLGMDSRPGLADLIRGEVTLAEAVRPTPFPNLKVLTAGTVGNKNYGEVLNSPATRDVLTQIRARFDYTLLDTPPVNTVSDVSTIAPHCDGVVMVIEMGRTPEPTVQEAVRTLQTTNTKILGCILSRYRDRRGRYYDRYYDYYYYYNNKD